MPGKGPNHRKKSGGYNITDTSVVSPQSRWPKEGLISNSHLKKPTYDDLNMAQWVSGQLNTILLIEDNVTFKKYPYTSSHGHERCCVLALASSEVRLGSIDDGYRGRSPSLDRFNAMVAE